MVESRITTRKEKEINVKPSSFVGVHPSGQLLDGVTNGMRFEFRVPEDFHSLLESFIVLVPRGTGNMDRAISTEWGKHGENYNNQSDSIPAGTVTVVANKIEEINVADALTGIEAGDEVGLTLTRRGGVGSDTVNAKCDVLKLVFRYN